jgi:hypothetical protein
MGAAMNCSFLWVLAAPALALVALTPCAKAQNINLKTVPIPTGEQFVLFPSHTLGMGSVAVAQDDKLAAPFSNPARRLEGKHRIRLFATPTFYGEANQWVGGRSFPLAVLFSGTRFHGGFGLAVQQLQDRPVWGWRAGSSGRVIREDPTNGYVFGTVGARVTERLYAGVSLLHASLATVDGVNMLYGRAWAIEQDGTLTELRLGAAGELGDGRTLEGTITRTSVDMTHDVFYGEWVWPGEPWLGTPDLVEWEERNEDRTITWGTRLRYSQPLDEGSRLGIILAGSTKDHPKIPNYNVVDIPRDPGNSAVFNLGAGVSRTEDGATVSMEVIFEPGRSHTWAFADTVIFLGSGAPLPPVFRLEVGDKTVDNQFRFMNWNLGLGFEQEGRRVDYQLGLRARRISYSLDQHNFVAESRRKTRESWMEWTPTWGLALRAGGLDLRYAGRFTAKGWVPMGPWGFGLETVVPDAGVDFVVGPTGPVNIPAYRVTLHRFMVSVPFGS